MFNLQDIAFGSKHTKGRIYREQYDSQRDEFQRDRGRVIHSSAFRKLAYKTQVFFNNEGDYYRTRLTHSLEVAQVAKSICYRLGLNQDLSETIALAHDLGHAPFAHSGEEGLQEALSFSSVNFEHNLQSLRIVVELERNYPEFNGLNLTWEAVEGLAKHHGPITPNNTNATIRGYDMIYGLSLNTYPTLEAQIASLADDIAYNNHDIDDALRSGFVTLDSVFQLPLVGEHFTKTRNAFPKIDQKILIKEALRSTMKTVIEDLVEQTARNVKNLNIKTREDVMYCGQHIVSFSDEMNAYNRSIKNFLQNNLYAHYKMHRMKCKGKEIVKNLFSSFYKDIRMLPTEWYLAAKDSPDDGKIVAICNYIAGMTDRFAIHEYQRIFGTFHNVFHN